MNNDMRETKMKPAQIVNCYCCSCQKTAPSVNRKKKSVSPVKTFSCNAISKFRISYTPKSGTCVVTCVKSKSNLEAKIQEVERAGNMRLIFSYMDMVKATNNFDPLLILGQGGFGRVYRGYIDSIDQVVAVKQLDRTGNQGSREFCSEILLLSFAQHPNLVNLIGYCAEGNERIVIYEYMLNGSLEDHIFDLLPGRKPLDWTTRMKIAAGAARGLEYLHEVADPPILFRDLKASNILLDSEFNPKLSDFGLAKIGPTGGKDHVSTRVMGTYGYCAPEYAKSGQLTKKSDIYSFGVLLLEIITGRSVIDKSQEPEKQDLISWATPLMRDKRMFRSLADPLLQEIYPSKGLYQALAVAAMCVQEDADFRPSIVEVVSAMEYIADQDIHEKHVTDASGSQNVNES